MPRIRLILLLGLLMSHGLLLLVRSTKSSRISQDHHVRSPTKTRKRCNNNDDVSKSSGTKDALKRHHRTILPVPKESIAVRAFRSLEELTKVIQNQAEAAIESSRKLKRRLKSFFSSDFEVLMLRMTTPDELRPSEVDVDRFIATIDTFVRNVDVTSQSNPYRVTLRKLWHKMAEHDGRTVIKALFLLHTILRNAAPEDSVIFKTLLTKMSREKCKKTGCKYFDTSIIEKLSSETQHLEDFISRYATYVLRRARTFTSGFEEMKLIGYGMRTEDICAQIMKAYKLLDSALLCRPSAEGECEVVLAALELVARDLRDLFSLYHEKLIWVLQEDEVGDLFADWEAAEVRAVLTHFKSFYNDRYEAVQAFLVDIGDVLQHMYHICIPTTLDRPVIFSDDSTISRRKSVNADGSGGGISSSFDADAAAARRFPSQDSDLGAVTETGESFSIPGSISDAGIPATAMMDRETVKVADTPRQTKQPIEQTSKETSSSGQKVKKKKPRPRAEAILRRKKSPLSSGVNRGEAEVGDEEESESTDEDWELPN